MKEHFHKAIEATLFYKIKNFFCLLNKTFYKKWTNMLHCHDITKFSAVQSMYNMDCRCLKSRKQGITDGNHWLLYAIFDVLVCINNAQPSSATIFSMVTIIFMLNTWVLSYSNIQQYLYLKYTVHEPSPWNKSSFTKNYIYLVFLPDCPLSIF